MPLKPAEAIRKPKRLGFEEEVGKGSHRHFFHADERATTVPMQSKELKRGTFRGILRQIEMTEEEFRAV